MTALLQSIYDAGEEMCTALDRQELERFFEAAERRDGLIAELRAGGAPPPDLGEAFVSAFAAQDEHLHRALHAERDRLAERLRTAQRTRQAGRTYHQEAAPDRRILNRHLAG